MMTRRAVLERDRDLTPPPRLDFFDGDTQGYYHDGISMLTRRAEGPGAQNLILEVREKFLIRVRPR
jgi:hypothetical protein